MAQRARLSAHAPLPLKMASSRDRAVDRPSDVGILATYIAFPETYVSQAALEKFDGAGEGKYQIGLGQGAFFIGGRTG